jgi:hypothetical protein
MPANNPTFKSLFSKSSAPFTFLITDLFGDSAGIRRGCKTFYLEFGSSSGDLAGGEWLCP